MYTYENELNRPVPADPELRAVNPILLDLLFRRGFKTEAAMRDILFPDMEQALQPLNCRDIGTVLSILESAVHNRTAMVVYHNDDTDGIAAGAVAVHLLGRLGVPIHAYSNSRKDAASGFCHTGIEQIQKRWPETDIILTAGNGITEHDAVDYANQRRLTVVVTDHHNPGMTLPDAAAVVDLRRSDEIYPYHDLCSCGLIFRIMLDLYRRLGKDQAPVLDMLDLVALATAAAEAPLTGENRALVQQGMKRINAAERPFFHALAQHFRSPKVNTEKTIPYCYAPLINSVSRMGEDTSLVISAVLTQDTDIAECLVSQSSEIHQRCKEENQKTDPPCQTAAEKSAFRSGSHCLEQRFFSRTD